jgi:hypothetical protein
MVVYHYVEFDSWKNIKATESLNPRSLQSIHREVSDPRSLTRATFALLQPEPKEWIQNELFPTLWDYFIGTRGDLLLEVDADEGKILVGDAGYIEGYLFRNHHQELNMPKKYAITDPNIAFRKYWDSLIPLSDYTDQGLQYCVPEAQIQFPVGLDNITVSHEQPLLERELGLGRLKDQTIPPIPSIYACQTELNPWINNFRNKNSYLEDVLHLLNNQNPEGRLPHQ